MNIFIFYRGKSAPSARALHASLKKSAPKNTVIIRGTSKSKFLKSRVFDYIINVGNSEPFGFKGSPTIVNHPTQIKRSANKRLARIRFKAKGIPAPTLWASPSDIPKKEYPVVGRTTYHMKAKGFWYCKNRAEALTAQHKGATHFIKFIKNTREFRAHVFATKPNPKTVDDFVIAKLSEKISDKKNASEIIKNHEAGYKFVAPKKTSDGALSAVRKLAKKTILDFGLHYGGVDIVYSKSRKKPLVLEINSTPCLTDDNSTTVDVYANKILQLTGSIKG